jgi:hypothetical protein
MSTTLEGFAPIVQPFLDHAGDARVAATLSDLETAPIEEPLRATVRLLGKLTREHVVDAEDVRAVIAVGVSRARGYR